MKNILFLSFFLCVLPLCGCDDGVKVEESCGDGFVDPGEECDGDNLQEQTCASLGHYNQVGTLRCLPTCMYDLAECAGRCGDNTVDAEDGEQCDGENMNGQTCQNQGFTGGTMSCTAGCRFDTSGCESACGNGHLEPGEECDDQARENGDGCSADCLVEPGWDCNGDVPPVCTTSCGDGIAAGNEHCDGEDLRGYNCQTWNGISYYGGSLTCTQDCQIDDTSCQDSGWCGDGLVQGGGVEACDEEDFGGATCENLGFHPGTLQCLGDCQTIDTQFCGGSCGDGVAQLSYETCDGADLHFDLNGDGLPDDCTDFGYYEGGLGCDTDCQTPLLSGCSLSCGDGVISSAYGEECEAGNVGGVTCTSLGYASGTLACGDDCRFDGGCIPWVGVVAGLGHTCALSGEGAVYCWGDNSSGQLGVGTTVDSTTPVPVLGLPAGITGLTAGGRHTCAFTGTGVVRCWGANEYGQLGDGTFVQRSSPVALAGEPVMDYYLTVSAGLNHTCADTVGGVVYCWGRNHLGQLGNGSNTASATAVQVSGILMLASGVASGGDYSCVKRFVTVNNANEVLCWGDNSQGQLGNGTQTPSNVPVTVTGLSDSATQVVAGDDFACAAQAHVPNHKFSCWGYFLMDGIYVVQTSAQNVLVGATHSYAGTSGPASRFVFMSLRNLSTSSVEIQTLGDNAYHQASPANMPEIVIPTHQPSMDGFVSFAAGAEHACGIAADGTLWCWGRNNKGQLGDSNTSIVAENPLQVLFQ
ncbi:DUF4215 domain-containing protein [Myxococcota bacterium]|nr:DUF4215 domain-containing protein [Myxococcota bacterium]MBU1510905.1 DUF4215 domain-containing protein [Myxococcota bacterium]